MRVNRRLQGSIYEKKAAEYLRTFGYEVLQLNYRCRAGEIDLIARHDGYLVFVEVKYRRNGRKGQGTEAVDAHKQSRIVRAASWYLMERRLSGDTPCRFDVVSFLGEEPQLLQDAFWC